MEEIDPRIQFIKKEYLTFTLSEHEKIIIYLSVDDVIHCCYRAEIFFMQYNHKILLSNWTINENIEEFLQVLKLATKNELHLNPEFTNEIGNLWNYICKKKNYHDEYSDETERERSLLTPYIAFNNYEFALWIYNDPSDNIILKITPLFPKGKPRNKIAKYNSFLHWMKSYKPISIRILPKDIAQQWLDQATQIDDAIKNNIKIINLMGKEKNEREVLEAQLNCTYDEQVIMAKNEEIANRQRTFDKQSAL